MKPVELTLCLIVKDEEKYVATCIESVKPVVDKILIADTGSSDRTISICKQYTDHVEQIDFLSGFSEARNHLLKQVKTEWVLFLDADEYFDACELEKLISFLTHVSSEVDALSVLRYNFFSSGAFYTSETIKLFRAHPDIYYSGVVVDSVRPSLQKKGSKIEKIPVLLNHFGHCRSVRIRNEKSHKYLNMMDEELLRNQNNFKVLGYKALILRTLGQLKEAKCWGEKALLAAPDEGHPHFVMGHIHRALDEHEKSIDAYSRAMELEGIHPTYLNSRGIAYLTKENFTEAENDFQLGQKLFPYHVHFTINLGLVYQARGNYKAAACCFEEVGRKHPAFLHAHFSGCSEIDPYSGYIYDTVFNFRGLSYHWAYCKAMTEGIL